MDKKPLRLLFGCLRLIRLKRGHIELGSINDLPVRPLKEFKREFQQWVQALVLFDVGHIVLLDRHGLSFY